MPTPPAASRSGLSLTSCPGPSRSCARSARPASAAWSASRAAPIAPPRALDLLDVAVRAACRSPPRRRPARRGGRGDAITQSMGRLNTALGSVERAGEIYDRLYRDSLQTGVAVRESVDAFARFSIAAREIGATSDQVATLSAASSASPSRPAPRSRRSPPAPSSFQALASGTLQGDELRSILEGLPTLAQALARELGVSMASSASSAVRATHRRHGLPRTAARRRAAEWRVRARAALRRPRLRAAHRCGGSIPRPARPGDRLSNALARPCPGPPACWTVCAAVRPAAPLRAGGRPPRPGGGAARPDRSPRGGETTAATACAPSPAAVPSRRAWSDRPAAGRRGPRRTAGGAAPPVPELQGGDHPRRAGRRRAPAHREESAAARPPRRAVVAPPPMPKSSARRSTTAFASTANTTTASAACARRRPRAASPPPIARASRRWRCASATRPCAASRAPPAAWHPSPRRTARPSARSTTSSASASG